MQVAVVGHVFGEQSGGIVPQHYVVEELRKTRIAIIIKQIAKDFDTVVDDDMHVLKRVEAVGLLEEMGRVTIEIG